MRENLGEQVTVDDMARAAMFSKFHFTRIFEGSTGVSPARFLAALRLQRAKKLLLSTTLTVADVSQTVGYGSVGTFSTRFTRSVGLPPARYRKMAGHTAELPADREPPASARSSGTVRGMIQPGATVTGERIFVGVFPERIPEGHPARYRILDRPGRFVLDAVPAGAWHVVCHAPGAGHRPDPTAGHPLVCSRPVKVRASGVAETALRLRPECSLDPPVLLAQLDAMS